MTQMLRSHLRRSHAKLRLACAREGSAIKIWNALQLEPTLCNWNPRRNVIASLCNWNQRRNVIASICNWNPRRNEIASLCNWKRRHDAWMQRRHTHQSLPNSALGRCGPRPAVKPGLCLGSTRSINIRWRTDGCAGFVFLAS